MSTQGTTHAIKISLTPFLGIALADILANGVAIIMLLIVVTMSSKYQLESERLEQVDEVARVLSRDIASSIVMNNLTSSTPAVLHDYVNSSTDKDKRHAVLPILELREQGIRNYYSGQIWTRQQLLRQDNEFDSYLNSLNLNQRLQIRTDIYEINMFYIYMSILKDHEIVPRHWHFSVESGEQSGGAKNLTGEDNNWAEFLPKDGEGLDGGGDVSGAGVIQRLGTDSDGSNYPLDRLLEENLGGSPTGTPGLASSQNEALPKQFRFRVASPEEIMQMNSSDFQLPDPNLKTLLAGALSYLKFINAELEQGRSVVKAMENLPQYMQQFILAPSTLSEREQEGIEEIIHIFQAKKSKIEDNSSRLAINQAQKEGLRGLAVEFPINQVVRSISVVGDVEQAGYLAKLPEFSEIYFHLQNYPELFKGLSIELLPGSILLMADYRASDDRWRWYPIFFIYPNFDDFVMGFIYGSIDSLGNMLVAAESNRVTVGGYSLQQSRDQSPSKSEYLLAKLFGMVLLFLFAIYVFLLWRSRLSVSANSAG